MKHAFASAVLLMAAASVGGEAKAYTFPAASQLTGWINSSGGQIPPTPDHNMFTGSEFGQRYNSFALFFIPAGNWTSATLSTSPSHYGSGGPNVIQFFDAHIDLNDLINLSRIGVDAFNDLGSGTMFGQAEMYDSPVSTSLNDAFLSEANASAGSYMLIGFTNATLNALPARDDQDDGIYVNGVGDGLAPIVLTLSDGVGAVPEPATWAMMIAGIGLAGGSLRRRRAANVSVRYA